jgi:hypothetical protein
MGGGSSADAERREHHDSVGSFRRWAEILIRKSAGRRRLDHDHRSIVTPVTGVARLRQLAVGCSELIAVRSVDGAIKR